MVATSVLVGMFGLFGTLVGAAASISTQIVLARRSRSNDLMDVRHDAAVTFTATARAIVTNYRMLEYVIAHGRGDLADNLFHRGLDAWSDYRKAQAAREVTCHPEILRIADDLQSALDLWVDAIDRVYLGADGDNATSEPYDRVMQTMSSLKEATNKYAPGRLQRRFERR